VVRTVRARPAPPSERVPLSEVLGRVLAAEVKADRDYPPADRSIRDGYAFRSTDVPGELKLVGEVRAGVPACGSTGPREAVEIMTGGIMPPGADAVAMVEHVHREGDRIRVDKPAAAGQFVNPRASEARAGSVLIPDGVQASYAHVAVMAMVGLTDALVYRRPRVAIIPTGDELVEGAEPVAPHQVRNSNAVSLAAQVSLAGGVPELAGIARDNERSTSEAVERGLECDMILLSGGVSAGKYDVVEPVLERLGAEFYFNRVLIQPGQPAVFGKVRGKWFFGLPGNPVSTMVTFEIFARAALELLGGLRQPELPLAWARLRSSFAHKPGLTRFLPARLCEGEIEPLKWQGSSDIAALAAANAWLVADPDRESWVSGELIQVLLR
jgi:molybdopterin molybdotransferase